MNDAAWTRVKHAFHGALERPPEARNAWIVEACGHDPALVAEVRSLLAAHADSPTFLESPATLEPEDLEVWPPGHRIGPYRIDRELGRGGMGVVYLAEDTQLGRPVALKALPPALAADEERRRRLSREARAAAAISHPGIAAVYAYQEIETHPVLVSEYVQGDTLRQIIANGDTTPARARVLARQMARALAAAHRAGVVHRDLKPENVIVTAADVVKIVDFGIAHLDEPAATRLTRAGARLGTPAYMAPEQLLGQPIDARADLYAFGVILAELVTGQHPLLGGHVAPSAYGGLAAVWLRCLQPDPAARFPSADALADAIDATSEPPVPPPIPGLGTRLAASPERTRALWWWQFHQGAAALVYTAMALPAWRARALLGGGTGRLFFVAALGAIIVTVALRWHLWFTARQYPTHLAWVRQRTRRWMRIADVLFAAALGLAGAGLLDREAAIGVTLLAVGIGAFVAFAVVEPATARAAFAAEPRPPVTPDAA